MEEPLDEDGGSRVPSRPTAKKKDGLDDPALADAGPDLNSSGEAVDRGPDLPKAVPEESRNDGALGVSGNPDDVSPQSGSNSGDNTAKKEDCLDDPALADAGPALISPGEIVDEGLNLSKAVPEESRLHGGNQSPSDGAPGVSGNPDDVAPESGTNSGDSGPEAVSIDPEDIALVDGNPSGVTAEVVQNPSSVAFGGVSKPIDVAQAGVGLISASNVFPGAVFSSGDLGPAAISSLDDVAPAVQNSGNVSHGLAGSFDDDSLGAGENPYDVASEAGSNPSDVALGVVGNPSDVTDGPVQNPGNGGQSNIVEMGQAGASEIEDQNPRNIVPTTNLDADLDEILWRRAVAEQDCNELTKLLAKEVRYFWWYEKRNEVGTALHAAATGGDLELAEHVLYLLSCAHEAGDPTMRFLDKELNVDLYVELERDGMKARAMAEERNHVAIEKRIFEYSADKERRRMHDMQRSRGIVTASTGSRASAEILKWNDAIKKKDCLALLIIASNVEWNYPFNVEKKLKDELVKVEVKNGKGGRQTALHIAAMQGCFELADFMLYRVQYIPSADVVEYILARDEVSGLTAFEMANDVIGNRSIAELIKACYKRHARNDNLPCRLRVNMVNDDHRVEYKFVDFETLVSFDAYPGTRWYTALENGDTIELKKLLEENSRFILETWHGLTVLHVAILWNDVELVRVVLKLFCNKVEDGDNVSRKWSSPYYPNISLRNSYSIYWGESYYPKYLSLDDMMRMDRKIDPGYLERYWDHLSNDWLSLQSRNMLERMEKEGFSVQSFADVIKGPNWIREEWTMITKDDESMSTMSSRMQNVFAQNLPPTFDGQFVKDVDFNFEDQARKDWLRFHYACKDPLKFNDFLQKMASYMVHHPYDAVKLLQTWDGKGRTPFHILMDHYNDEKDPGWPFIEIFNHECFKEWIQIVENPRGKRMIDILLTKNYLQQNVNLQPWTYREVNFSYEKFECSEETAFLHYQVAACFVKQKDMVQEIWSTLLEKKDLSRVMKKNLDAFNSMLFIAASTGNQSFLHLLLETNHDPMVIDSNGRSLLHHVADPTILLSHLLGYCSLTIEDVVDVKRKLMGSNPIFYPQPSSNSSTRNISLEEMSNVGRKACILMLLQAGVDLGQTDKDGKVPTIGPTIDANYQSWWHDMVVKDSTDKKNAMSQAGNALSVVGTLVAATSYVGPLQPPLSFDDKTGFVKTNELLIKVFMVSNSVAFYLAMASVMFAVVSSLPMPQEGVISELNRAKHVISWSLCLLQIAIGSIIISYATASIVAIQNENMIHPSNLLFSPSIIGWFFCLLGIGGFLIRLARLMFYKNQIVKNIYQFSFSKFTFRCLWVIIVGPFCLICLGLAMIFNGLGVISSMIPTFERRDLDTYFDDIRGRLFDFANSLLM